MYYEQMPRYIYSLDLTACTVVVPFHNILMYTTFKKKAIEIAYCHYGPKKDFGQKKEFKYLICSIKMQIRKWCRFKCASWLYILKKETWDLNRKECYWIMEQFQPGNLFLSWIEKMLVWKQPIMKNLSFHFLLKRCYNSNAFLVL